MRHRLRSSRSWTFLFPILIVIGLLPASRAGAALFMGVPVETLGSAEFAAAPHDTLRIQNLGSSGMDGISVSLLDVCNHWDMEILSIENGGSVQNGSTIDISFWKYTASAPDSLIGIMHTEKVANDTWSLSVQYPYPSYRLEAWSGGTLVWSADGYNGSPVKNAIPGFLDVGTIDTDGGFPKNDFHGNYAPVWTTDDDVVYMAPDTFGPIGPFMIDALKVIPEGGPGVCPPMSRVDVLCSGIGDMTVTYLAISASDVPDVDIDAIQHYDALTMAPDSPYDGQYVRVTGQPIMLPDTVSDDVFYLGSVDPVSGKPSGIRIPALAAPILDWTHEVEVSGVVSVSDQGEIMLLAPTINKKEVLIPEPIPTFIPVPDFIDNYEYVGAFAQSQADSFFNADADRVIFVSGEDTIVVYIDPATGIDVGTLPTGQLYSLSGIVIVRDGQMMLMPREQNDLHLATSGELHNLALQYLFDHQPVFDSPIWLKRIDVETIADLLIDFCVSDLGLDRPAADQLFADHFAVLEDMSMFFDFEGTTYYGSPVFSDDYIRYVCQYDADHGGMSQDLADHIAGIADLTSDRCDCDTVVMQAINDMQLLPWTPSDQALVDWFIDVAAHSYQFWTNYFTATKEHSNLLNY